MSIDRIVTLAAAISAPLLTLLVDQHVLGAAAATDVGAVVVAFVAALHIPNDAARAALAAQKSALQQADPGVTL